MTLREAVTDLLHRSAYALDQKQLPALEDCFAPEAVFTLVIEGGDEPAQFAGRDAIMGLMKGALDVQTDERKHVISNIWYESEGDDEVTAVSYLTLMATENAVTRLITTGVYRDRLIRDGERWLIDERHLTLDRPY